MNEVRAMIAMTEHTRVCSTPYKIGAITHVHSDHLGDANVCRVRVVARVNAKFFRVCRLSSVATRNFFARRAAENCAAPTVESSVAKRCVGLLEETQAVTLMSLRAARSSARVRAGRDAKSKCVRFANSDRPCTLRGASRVAQLRIRENAVARVTGADGLRRVQSADAPNTSFASHTRRADGVALYLRLIGQMPVSAVPCDRNAGGVAQWDTASRREPSPGAT